VGRPRLRLGIPVQILLVSSFLLLLPWLGLELVREQQRLVLDGQERALAATARRAAVALSDRPSLFLAGDSGSGPGGVLRILDLPGPVVSDGYTEDWDDANVETHPLPDPGSASTENHSAVYRIGRQGGGVYVLFEVRDPGVVLRDPEHHEEGGDHLEIAVVTADDEFLRFVVDATADGPVAAWLLRDGRPIPDNRIAGTWRTTPDGYVVELRLPRTLVGARLAFAVVDVRPQPRRHVAGRLESSALTTPGALAVVLAPSPEMDDLLARLAGPRTQVWVIDAGKHILAHAGSLTPEAPEAAPEDGDEDTGWLLDRLARVTDRVVPEPPVHGDGPEVHEVDHALGGQPATRWRTAAGSRALVLSATHPVRVEGQVRAVVLAREKATRLLRVRGRAFEKILGAILGVALFGLVALLAFAARLSMRVRSLRDGVERLEAGGADPPPVLPGARARDEVGDLARSVTAMAERQREQTAYLEQVGRRLSHEMRTPVGVVRSSLDNLRLGSLPPETRVYLDRADEGVRRLSLILSRLGEATRLEQTLASTERERFDLVPVVRGSVEGYRAAHPDRVITVQDPGEPLPVEGAPDLLAQLLDKLVDNALGFARPGTAVEVDLWRFGGAATLSVRNEGPRLPLEMGGRLFESMVSVRPDGTRAGEGAPHLGLGLYIVRLIAEFHGGTTAAHDRPDGRGVIVTVTLPLVPAEGATPS
jgi:dedicated sortase system histidine kinase